MTGRRAPSDLLSPDAYMALLVERARAEDERIGATWVRTLPEWMVRVGDEHIVDMDAIHATNARRDAQPRHPRRPRTYRPAAHWRAQLARIDGAIAAAAPQNRHPTIDPAAYGGIGIRQTPRQRRRQEAAMDLSIEHTARLMARRRDIASRLARAEAREAPRERTAPFHKATGRNPE